jgi:hypothetical protein
MKISKQYIKDLVFPRKEGLENKWWHRLITVLLCASTFLVLIFSCIIVVSQNHNWYKYTVNSYNFEENYNQAEGKEVSCSGVPTTSTINSKDRSLMMFCDNHLVDSKNFKVVNGLDLVPVKVKAKITSQFLYPSFFIDVFKSLLIVIVLTLGWFILWESIIYRTFLYIVYGNKK